MRQLFFLAGLPRSGSTLLAALLNQHPEIYATATSPLMDLLCMTDRSIANLAQQYNFDRNRQEHNIYSGIIDYFHRHISKPIIFDKHRGWPRNLSVLQRFVYRPRIICPFRSVAEVITSYITLIDAASDKPNFIDHELSRDGVPKTTENRAMLLWRRYVSDPYMSMKSALETAPDHILMVHYDDLVTKPLDVLDKIYKFTGIRPFFDLKYDQIENMEPERDLEAWGIHNLHTLRPKLMKTSLPPETVLGQELTRYFQQFDFTRPESLSLMQSESAL